MRRKLLLFFTTLVSVCIVCGAQDVTYSGSHRADGTHRNEVSGYLQGGDNVVSNFFIGPAVSYKHHFNDHWSVGGASQMQFHKQHFSVAAKGTWRISPWRPHYNLYISARGMYSRYNQWGTNEYVFNISATWEHPYFDITVGESLIYFHLLHTHYTEPPTLTFGASVNIRDRRSPWNLGLFARNYDEFYYENWNINWGLHWNARLNDRMRLFGELNVRPAGSISQLASRYETSMKIGMKYVW